VTFWQILTFSSGKLWLIRAVQRPPFTKAGIEEKCNIYRVWVKHGPIIAVCSPKFMKFAT